MSSFNFENIKPLNEIEQFKFMKPFIESEKQPGKKMEYKLILVLLDSIIRDGYDSDTHLPLLIQLFRFYYHQPYDFQRILYNKSKHSLDNSLKVNNTTKENNNNNNQVKKEVKREIENNEENVNYDSNSNGISNIDGCKTKKEEQKETQGTLSFGYENQNHNEIDQDDNEFNNVIENIKVSLENISHENTNHTSNTKKLNKIQSNSIIDKMSEDDNNPDTLEFSSNVNAELKSIDENLMDEDNEDQIPKSNRGKPQSKKRKKITRPNPNKMTSNINKQAYEEDEEASVYSEAEGKSRMQKNPRTVDIDRQNQESQIKTRDFSVMDEMDLFAAIDSPMVENINLEEVVVDFPKMFYEDDKINLVWQSEIFGFSINLSRSQNSKELVKSKYYVVHKALERLQKADCLNMTENEVQDALNVLRNKYDIKEIPSESSGPSRLIKCEDYTLEFFMNADQSLNSFTKLPYMGIHLEQNRINFNFKKKAANLQYCLTRKYTEENFEHVQLNMVHKAQNQMIENNIFDIDLDRFNDFIKTKIDSLEPLKESYGGEQAQVNNNLSNANMTTRNRISKEMLIELDLTDPDIKIPYIQNNIKESKQIFRVQSIKVIKQVRQDRKAQVKTLIDLIYDCYSECCKHNIFENLNQNDLEEAILFLREKFAEQASLLPSDEHMKMDLKGGEGLIDDENSKRSTLSVNDELSEGEENEDEQAQDTQAEPYRHNYFNNKHPVAGHTNPFSKLGLISKEVILSAVMEPDQFKLPYISVKTTNSNIVFNQKNEKQNIKKCFNKKFTEDNFSTVAIQIIEKGQEMLTSEDILPNLTKSQLHEALDELKTKQNQEETELVIKNLPKFTEITKEWIMEVDLNSSEDNLPFICQREEKVCFVQKREDKKFSVSRKVGNDCSFAQAKLGVFFRGYKWMIDNKILTNINLPELSQCINELFKRNGLTV